MDKTKFFPILIIGLQFGAMTVYLVSGDFRKALYWLGGVILTSAITF